MAIEQEMSAVEEEQVEGGQRETLDDDDDDVKTYWDTVDVDWLDVDLETKVCPPPLNGNLSWHGPGRELTFSVWQWRLADPGPVQRLRVAHGRPGQVSSTAQSRRRPHLGASLPNCR